MKLSKKLENLFSATAFAEEGEFDTAREIMAEDTQSPERQTASGDVRRPTTPQIKNGRLAQKA